MARHLKGINSPERNSATAVSRFQKTLLTERYFRDTVRTVLSFYTSQCTLNVMLPAVLRIRISMDPQDCGLLDPHPESAFQMRIPDADAHPATKFELPRQSSILCNTKFNFFKTLLLFKKIGLL